MKKSYFLCAALASCLLFGLNSCDNKQAKQEKVVVEKEEATEEAATDIFFYTSKHRADKYSPTEEKLGFGSQIQSVNPDEFKDNTNIREVWIAPQIQHIAERAFTGCTSLEKVHFQGELAVINDEAFKGCTALKNLRVNAYTIGLDAFRGCSSLETARFGENIWWSRSGAFADCKKLRSVLMGIAMKKIEDGVFEGSTGIEEFSIPNDFKNRMFGLVPSPEKWKKVYLLSTEYYDMPKNCTPGKNCTLYVPDAFLPKFKANAEWMQFGSIEPLSKSKYFTAEGFWK